MQWMRRVDDTPVRVSRTETIAHADLVDLVDLTAMDDTPVRVSRTETTRI